MAYLWFRTDMTDKPSSDRRTHPWCVQLESKDRYYVSIVTGINGGFTMTDGRQYGLPVDHVLCFDGALACLCDAKPVGH